MEIIVQEEVLRQLQEIMIKGGELKVIVEVRGLDRIPTIYCWPGNKIVCKTERLTE